jgi:hypothetical protein
MSVRISSRQDILEDGSVVKQVAGKSPLNELRGTYNPKTQELFIDWLGAARPGYEVGPEMVSRAIEGLGTSKVKSLAGNLEELNLEVFTDLYQNWGYTKLEAATRTPAAKLFEKLGYKQHTFDYKNNLLLRSTKE